MRRLILAAVLLAPSPALAGKRYASLMVDRIDLTATLGEPLGIFSNDKSYYELTGRRVSDIRDGANRGAYDLSPENRIVHRERSLLVLDVQAGRVYAAFDYTYPPGVSRIAVNTFTHRPDFPHRVGEPGRKPSAPADSFALIRSFTLPGSKRNAVATADYDSAGKRRSFRVAISTGGGFMELRSPDEAYLPESVDPRLFSERPFDGVEGSPELGELHAALVYHGRGTAIERIVVSGLLIKREWLSYPLTETERALAKIEARLPLKPGP